MHDKSAIDVNGLSRNVRCAVRGQENDHVRNVLGCLELASGTTASILRADHSS